MLNNKKCFFQEKLILIHQCANKQNIYHITLIYMYKI